MKPEEIIEKLYVSYKSGFTLGAQGIPPYANCGSPAPESMTDWKQGHEDGQDAFRQAMKAAWERFHAQVGIEVPK